MWIIQLNGTSAGLLLIHQHPLFFPSLFTDQINLFINIAPLLVLIIHFIFHVHSQTFHKHLTLWTMSHSFIHNCALHLLIRTTTCRNQLCTFLKRLLYCYERSAPQDMEELDLLKAHCVKTALQTKGEVENYSLWHFGAKKHESKTAGPSGFHWEASEYTTRSSLWWYSGPSNKTQHAQDKSPIKVNFAPCTNTDTSCAFCAGKHTLVKCQKIYAKSEANIEFLKDNGLRFECLKVEHLSKNCKRRMKCQSCQGKHLTILHIKTFPKFETDTRWS